METPSTSPRWNRGILPLRGLSPEPPSEHTGMLPLNIINSYRLRAAWFTLRMAVATPKLMSQPPPNSNLRSLAAKLIARESTSIADAGENRPLENSPPAFRVTERLRVPLSRLAGIAGYRVLLSRALSVAKSQDPSLAALRVDQAGSLEGVNGFASPGNEAGVILISQLIGLLVTFIGETLTLALIVEAWPDFTVTDSQTLEKREDEPRR